MELDYFLGQHWVNVCLLTETQLRSGEALRMAICICPHTSRLAERGGTVTVVRRGIDHYLVVPSHPTHFLLQGICDLDNFPHEACVDLIRQLLTSVLTLPTGAACARADLKIVTPLCINISAQPRRTSRGIAPRPACGRNSRQEARTLTLPQPTRRRYMPPK